MLDLLIIGSGPAGLSAAVYAKRSNMDFMVAEKDFMGAGQIMNSIQVDNYLGFYGISGYDLGDKFRQHAEALLVPFYTGEAVSIEKTPGGFKTCFYEGQCIESKTIIYAAGTKPNRLDLPGEKSFDARGIHFCVVCEGFGYRDKTVAVVGGGDTAVDSARYLADIAAKVYVIHWLDEFQANRESVRRLKELENVEILTGVSVKSVSGKDQLEELTLSDGRTLKVDGLFEAIGATPQTKLLEGLVDLDERGYVIAGEDGVTSQKGLFVAGDIRTKQLRQVVTAVADGANAQTSALDYLKDRDATAGSEDKTMLDEEELIYLCKEVMKRLEEAIREKKQ